VDGLREMAAPRLPDLRLAEAVAGIVVVAGGRALAQHPPAVSLGKVPPVAIALALLLSGAAFPDALFDAIIDDLTNPSAIAVLAMLGGIAGGRPGPHALRRLCEQRRPEYALLFLQPSADQAVAREMLAGIAAESEAVDDEEEGDDGVRDLVREYRAVLDAWP